jgi:hypothetical protein
MQEHAVLHDWESGVYRSSGGPPPWEVEEVMRPRTSTASVWHRKSAQDHVRARDAAGGSSTDMADAGSRAAAGLTTQTRSVGPPGVMHRTDWRPGAGRGERVSPVGDPPEGRHRLCGASTCSTRVMAGAA